MATTGDFQTEGVSVSLGAVSAYTAANRSFLNAFRRTFPASSRSGSQTHSNVRGVL
jgi:hypothetical protein